MGETLQQDLQTLENTLSKMEQNMDSQEQSLEVSNVTKAVFQETFGTMLVNDILQCIKSASLLRIIYCLLGFLLFMLYPPICVLMLFCLLFVCLVCLF